MARLAPLAALLVAAACAKDLVAVYEGGRVTGSELAAWIETRGREAARREPEQLLQALVATRLLAAEARAAGLAERPEVAIRLQQEELAPWRAALQAHLRAGIEVPGAEVEAFLAAHRADLERPRRVRLWNLFKQVPEAASPETREAIRREAESLRARLAAGEDFAALAASESDSQTRFRGGRMGAIPPGTLRPEIEAVAFALEEGEISEVVETPEGFTVLRCHGIIEASTTPEEEGRRRIREAMQRWKFEEQWPALLARLEAEAAAVVDRDALSAPAGAATDVVARSPLGELTRVELAALAAAPAGATASAEQAAAAAGRHFTALAVRRHAGTLGLEPGGEEQEKVARRQEQLLAEAALARRVEERFTAPSEEEVRRFFAAQPGRFSAPPFYRLGWLRFEFDDATLREVTRAAEAASERAGAAGFDAVARELEGRTAVTVRPDTGWLPRPGVAGLGPSVLKTVETLSPGTTSEPVRQDRFLWVLHLHGFEPARPMTFEEAAGEARAALEAERRSRLRTELVASLLEQAGFRIVGPLPEVKLRPGARGKATRVAA